MKIATKGTKGTIANEFRYPWTRTPPRSRHDSQASQNRHGDTAQTQRTTRRHPQSVPEDDAARLVKLVRESTWLGEIDYLRAIVGPLLVVV